MCPTRVGPALRVDVELKGNTMTDAAAPQPGEAGGRGARFWVLAIIIGVAIIVAAILIYNASMAAFTANTTASGSFTTGAISLEDDDFEGAGFTFTDLAPGDTGSDTIDVTYTGGTITSDITLYADPAGTADTGLADDIELTITENATAGTWTGTLAEFQGFTTFADGILPVTAEGDAVVIYTVEYTVLDSAESGQTASVGFVWEAQSQPSP